MPNDFFKRLRQRARVVRMVGVADQLGAAVDVPADNQDLVLRLAQAVPQRGEVLIGVNQPAEATGP